MMQDDTLDMKIGLDPLIAYCHIQLDAMAKCSLVTKQQLKWLQILHHIRFSFLLMQSEQGSNLNVPVGQDHGFSCPISIINKLCIFWYIHVWEKRNGYDVTYMRCKDRL